jgi:Ca2+-binding RTX toxin-like protein
LNQTIGGGEGVDRIIDVEAVVGSNFNDTLSGGIGPNSLTGGNGNDILTGGTGDDLFVFDDGSGDDTITDFTAGAGTDDVLDFRHHFQANSTADLTITQSGSDALIQFGTDSVLLTSVNVSSLNQDDYLF